MTFPYEEFDLSGVTTYPLKSRASKARARISGGRTYQEPASAPFVDALPNILAAADFKAVVRAIVDAKRAGGGVVWGLGAHVIKTGLGPVLIDLMERGFVSAIATNGAAVIHDFEVALVGATSEDVDEALGPGRFGMADETGRLLNGAINDGVGAGLGIGQAVGRFLASKQPQFARASVLAAAARLEIPVTVHVAIGTDIIHMHPAASGRGDRRGQPARLPVLRLERRAARARRVPELRIRRRPSGGLSEGGRARAQSRRRARGADDGESRLRALVPAADQRRRAPDGGNRPRILAGRAPRAHDPAAGRRPR